MPEERTPLPCARIASLTLASPLVLAPLAGYTDLPFRLLCRRLGAALTVTEMVSCHGLAYAQPKTLRLLASAPEERPVSVQLFGGDPETMGRAATLASSHPFDLVDINMGCPARKVIKRGAGAALMRDPQRARAVIAAVVRNSRLPVTVKMRTGWSHREKNAVDLARWAEDLGVAAVTVHGRTWSDGFSGPVDLETIGAVKEAVSIPVIGNGDVHSRQEAAAMMAATGCDLVMIGRAAIGRPWLFGRKDDPPPAERAAIFGQLLALARQYTPDRVHLAKLQRHAAQMFKGIAGAAELRRRIFAVSTLSALESLVQHLVSVKKS